MTNAQEMIRTQYAAGKTFQDIAGALTQAGLSTPSGLSWDANRVASTVGNMKLTRKAGTAKAAPIKRAKKTTSKRKVQARAYTKYQAAPVVNAQSFQGLVLGFIRDVQASGAAPAQRNDMIQAVLSAYNG